MEQKKERLRKEYAKGVSSQNIKNEPGGGRKPSPTLNPKSRKGTKIMVKMNSVINVKMTVTEANLFYSTCRIAVYELKDSDPISAKELLRLCEKIKSTLNKLDYSENEQLVNKINANIAKLDSEISD